MEQMNVVTAIIHGRLESEVYMKIPPYMNVPNPENKALKPKGALYGLEPRSHVRGNKFLCLGEALSNASWHMYLH